MARAFQLRKYPAQYISTVLLSLNPAVANTAEVRMPGIREVSMFSVATRAELRTQIGLALPVLAAQISQVSLGFVDTVMTGRVSPLAMASVALASSMWMPVILFGQGILLAATPALAQMRGSHADPGAEARIIRQSLILSMLLTIPLLAVFGLLSTVLPHVGITGDLEDISRRYMQALAWGMPGYFLMVALRCCMEGFARVRPAMVAGIVGVLVNVPCNYVLIFGKLGCPAMGGVGAGVASAITCWAMAGTMLLYALRMPDFRAAMGLRAWDGVHWQTLRRLVSIGLPGALALLFEVTMFNIVALLIAPLGPIMMAGHQVAMNFSALMFMLPLSLNIAVTIRVGYGLGRGDQAMVRRSTRVALLTGLALAATTALLTIVFRESIALIYNNDPQVFLLATSLLIVAGTYQCTDSIQVVSVGVLRGYNDTRAIFFITLLSYWFVALPVGYILGRTDLITPAMGPQGFWIGFVVGLSVAALLLLLRVRTLEKRAAGAF